MRMKNRRFELWGEISNDTTGTCAASQPVPSGTRGTVQCVDDLGQLQMRWDNGRGLALIPGEDDFRKLTAAELAAEQSTSLDEPRL